MALLLIGRVVELCGIIEQPHLNGALGNVENYIEASNRYGVRVLYPERILSLKISKFKIVNQSPADKIPHIHQNFEYLRSGNIPINSKFEIRAGTLANNEQKQIYLNSSCSLFGARSNPDDEGIYHPTSCVMDLTFIAMGQDDNSIIHIEDLNIVMSKGETMRSCVTCRKGTVILRRCRFSCFDAAIDVMGEGNSFANVFMKNCVIENGQGSGALIESKGICNFLNCTIRDNKGTGIEVRNAGDATIKYCKFYNNTKPAVTGILKATLYISHCCFNGSGDSCILVAERSKVEVVDTIISGANMAGIVVQFNGSLIAKRCEIRDCLTGCLFQLGKCTVTVAECIITKNKLFGIHVCQDCMGKITLHSNDVSLNRKSQIENDSNPESCFVEVNDVVFSGIGTMRRLAQENPDAANRLNRTISDNFNSSNNPGCRPALDTFRASKKNRCFFFLLHSLW